MRSDKSSLFLIFSNLFTILIAVVENWDLSLVMWIYWGQSVVIGFFNWKRMRSLKRFSTQGLTMNDSPVPETESGRRKVSTFFAVHYGFFHFGYLVFLLAERNNLSLWDILGVFVCVAVFFYNHRYSYAYNLENDLKRIPNIGTLMFFPYARILPMHFTIIMGSWMADAGMGELAFFLLLKTLADWIMHVVEHRPG
nr:DUF6498-containing protein [Desulfobacterales bacterium]